MRSTFRCEACSRTQNVESHAGVDAMTVDRDYAEPLERAYPDIESHQHACHNAIISGKPSSRYRYLHVTIVSQYKKREEVHPADANQLALTSGAPAPQLRVDRLDRIWTLSRPPLPSEASTPRIHSAQELRYTRR